MKSAKEFEKRLLEEFDYLVNPLVFDLSLKLSNEAVRPEENSSTKEHCYYEIEKVKLLLLHLMVVCWRRDTKQVYGSPEADTATGELMQVSTLFPSPMKNEQTKVFDKWHASLWYQCWVT